MRCAWCKGETYNFRRVDTTPICGARCLASYVNSILDSTFTKEDMMGLFEEGFAPTVNDDSSGSFKPIKGAYKARIDKLNRMVGVSERTGNDYDFYSLKMQVLETVDGERGNNRFLDKIYSGDSKGRSKLANDLFTAGLEYSSESEEAFDASLEELKDKEVNVRAWVRAKQTQNDEGTWVDAEPREDKQQTKIVKEFDLKGKTASSANTEEIPF